MDYIKKKNIYENEKDETECFYFEEKKKFSNY